MLVESLIEETMELQGFRVVTVQRTDEGLEAKVTLDKRYAPRCGTCGRRAHYRDTRVVPAGSGMCRCGGSLYIWCMPRAG